MTEYDGASEDSRTGPHAARLAIAGAALAVAVAGCMTAQDPYGPRDDYPGGYDAQGGYGADQYPGADDYAAPYQGAASVAPRRIGGTIETRDFPRDGAPQRDGRSALYRIDVGPDGRVTGCRASEPSGLPELDAFMCRLISDRFTYEPARDAGGRPVAGVAGWRQSWDLPGR